MEIGMLWFDDSQLPMNEKITRAVAFYNEKYGRTPTLCLVHPNTLNGGEGGVVGVEIRQTRTVMPNHFWIGVDDKSKESQPVQLKAA